MAVGLPHQSVHLGMAPFSVYNNLFFFRIALLIRLFDLTLQLQNHRTCGIDDFYTVLPCYTIGLGRLTVRP